MRPGFHLHRHMRIGLLGGAFDPAHPGHRHVAEAARKARGLDRVIWLVSPRSPFKAGHEGSLTVRMASARAVAGRHGVVSGIEADLGSSYTVHTLRWLRRRFAGVRFFFLMGTDNLLRFHHWKRWREIPRLAEVVVVARPGSTVKGRLAPGGRYLRARGAHFLAAPLHADSSTALRKRAKGLGV
jgi:nicotinate-nucleotide adenylyltransferase